LIRCIYVQRDGVWDGLDGSFKSIPFVRCGWESPSRSLIITSRTLISVILLIALTILVQLDPVLTLILSHVNLIAEEVLSNRLMLVRNLT
jgi:hypothetical protein